MTYPITVERRIVLCCSSRDSLIKLSLLAQESESSVFVPLLLLEVFQRYNFDDVIQHLVPIGNYASG